MLISQVRGSKPLSLVALSTALGSANREFISSVTDMDRAVSDTQAYWKGAASTAASMRALSEKMSSTHVETAVSDVAAPLAETGMQFDSVRTALLVVVDGEAPPLGMTVADDGAVTAPTMYYPDPIIAALIQKEFNDSAAWLEQRIRELLTTADDLDARGAMAISDALSQLGHLQDDPSGGPLAAAVTDITSGSGSLPTDPQALHDFWETLSPAEKDALYDHDPFIGNRDGIPHLDRDAYNRQHLAELQDAVVEERNRLHQVRHALPEEQWQEQYDAIETRAQNLSNIAAEARLSHEPPRLLSLVTENHAAIAVNNPDTADAVATYVAGTSSGVHEMQGGTDRAQAMWDAAIRADDMTRTSVIAWYGYDAPQNPLTESPLPGYASAAATPLNSFQEGLRVTHKGTEPSINTLVGHSYGTTAIGHASSRDLTMPADQLVFAGSPGVGLMHVSQIQLAGVDPSEVGQRVFATTNDHDPIRNTPYLVHGPEPITSAFGATEFRGSTELGPWWKLGLFDVDQHGSYWDAEHPSLTKMGQIIVGRGEEVS